MIVLVFSQVWKRWKLPPNLEGGAEVGVEEEEEDGQQRGKLQLSLDKSEARQGEKVNKVEMQGTLTLKG